MYTIDDIKNQVLLGDCLEVLKNIPNNTFDFCYADPPYYLRQKGFGQKSKQQIDDYSARYFYKVDDNWDKFDSQDDYNNFLRLWLTEVHRVLKDNGSICVSISWQQMAPLFLIMQDIGYCPINNIIWYKPNAMPKFIDHRTLNNKTEYILFMSKSEKNGYTYNYRTAVKLNGGELNTLWQINIIQGKERLTKDFAHECESINLHPTQKPEELITRIIRCFTKLNDFVLDPFGGTFTTAVCCKRCGRDYFSIEKEKTYFDKAKVRLDNTSQFITELDDGSLEGEKLHRQKALGQQQLF